MSDEDRSQKDVWQYRFAFDGVGNAGTWSGIFYNLDSCQDGAERAQGELVQVHGLSPAIQYRKGTRTVTIVWEEA